MKINSEYHWQVILFEAKIGDTQVELSKSPSSVILDSGSSLIYIPTKEFNSITTEIYTHKLCSKNTQDNFVYCPCDANLESLNAYPTIEILMGDFTDQHYFSLEGSDYLIYDDYWMMCLLTLQEETREDTWLMGDPFLRKYYTIHDMEDPPKIGLVGVASSTRKYFNQDIGEPENSFTMIIGDMLGLSEDDSALLEILAGVIATIFICICVYCV